ncbi:hypothetical protein MNB_SV-5-636 [hydrothermal vent metagenome]|uniref:Uncharacterized protein n=1 Tax=hydrothermal vent metagenome TaxID=652676 RepID=A0A1W1EFV9_9ZZZZ
MKNIILIVSLLTASLYADLNINQIENMILKIHKKRVGYDLNMLESTKNPFVVLEEENNVTTFVVKEVEDDVKISLHAIVAKKAYINDGWKDVNDTIMGYTLKYIGKRGVVLRNRNHIKKLFLSDKRDNFITVEGR